MQRCKFYLYYLDSCQSVITFFFTMLTSGLMQVKEESEKEGEEESEEESEDDNHQLKDPQLFLSTQKIMSCSESGKGLSHKRAQKTAGFFFTCLECKINFESKEHLMDHFRVHSGESCTETETSLVQKVAQSIECKLPFTCFQCQKSFACKQHLMDHYRIHTVDRPFLCDQCDKSFIHKQSLKNHLRVHTGLRPHVCQQCGKR